MIQNPDCHSIKLNCWVLGQKIKDIFQVNIPVTETASDLRKLIKNENPDDFRGVAANKIALYKVRVLFDENLENLLGNFTSTLSDRPCLTPWTTINALFPASKEPGEWLVVVDPDVDLQLNCLVLGDHSSQYFSVKIAGTASVHDLKRLIKQAKGNDFRNIDVNNFDLHEVSLPKDEELDAKLRHLTLDVPLDPGISLWTLFAQVIEENIHILVKRHGKLDSIIESFKRTIMPESPTPSKTAKSSEYVKIQSSDQRILDGCYTAGTANTAAPPIQLFSPAFAHFSSKAFDPEYDVPDDFARNVSVLMTHFALIYLSKEDRQRHITELLETAIDHPLDVITSDDKTAPDFVAMSSCEELSVYLVIGAEGNEFCDGGSDPSERATLSFLHTLCQKKNAGLLMRSCCPTFIVAHAGPWLTIMGGVFTGRCIVQRLTDLLWVPVHSTHDDNQCRRIARVLYALRESIQLLDLSYQTIKAVTPFDTSARHIRVHPRFCPSPNAYRYKNTLVKFAYRAPLETSDSCVAYRASTIEDKPRDIVVKFVTSYGEDVHEKMASLGFAPELFYCGPIKVTDDMPPYGNLRMVVMGYVEGRTLEVAMKQGKVPPRLQDDLSRAFEALHGAGYVYGDLGESNVMVTSGLRGTSTAQLIDFDWAGKEGKVKYPFSIPSSIYWPAGLRALAPIRKEHDLFMLRSVKSRCSYAQK